MNNKEIEQLIDKHTDMMLQTERPFKVMNNLKAMLKTALTDNPTTVIVIMQKEVEDYE